jgi:hypothetical protein
MLVEAVGRLNQQILELLITFRFTNYRGKLYWSHGRISEYIFGSSDEQIKYSDDPYND